MKISLYLVKRIIQYSKYTNKCFAENNRQAQLLRRKYLDLNTTIENMFEKFKSY